MHKIIAGFVTVFLLSGYGFSQKTLIPYKAGKYWGLCNESATIVVAPVYDVIETLDYGLAFRTVKNDKQGAIYNGKEIIKPACEHVLMQDNRFFINSYSIDGMPTLESSRQVVYNLKGEKIITKPVREITLVPQELAKNEAVYVTFGVNNNSQVFVYDTKNEKIKQVLLSNKPGMFQCSVSKEKKAIYMNNYDEVKNVSVVISYDKKLSKYTITPQKKMVQPQVQVKEADDFNFDLTIVKNNFVTKTTGFVKKNDKVMMRTRYQRYHEAKFKADSVLPALDYDEAFINKFTQGNGTALYEYTTSPNNESDKEHVDTIFAYSNYVTIKKNGLLGFMCEDKIVEPQFTGITDFRAASELKPYFLVSKLNAGAALKWGIIRADGQYILPIVYDEITYNNKGGYGQFFILKNDNKYGIALNDGTIVKHPQFDLITPNELFYSLNIMNGSRYGYYDINGNFCEPILPYKVKFVDTFNNKKFLRLVNDKEVVMGYANFEGTVYFK